jgi:hypothetical protein
MGPQLGVRRSLSVFPAPCPPPIKTLPPPIHTKLPSHFLPTPHTVVLGCCSQRQVLQSRAPRTQNTGLKQKVASMGQILPRRPTLREGGRASSSAKSVRSRFNSPAFCALQRLLQISGQLLRRMHAPCPALLLCPGGVRRSPRKGTASPGAGRT